MSLSCRQAQGCARRCTLRWEEPLSQGHSEERGPAPPRATSRLRLESHAYIFSLLTDMLSFLGTGRPVALLCHFPEWQGRGQEEAGEEEEGTGWGSCRGHLLGGDFRH